MTIDFLAAIPAYFLGSIPTAVWIGKAKYGVDVRELGSKNAGATNTFRVLGKKAGKVVLLIDVLKGMLAVMLPFFILPSIARNFSCCAWSRVSYFCWIQRRKRSGYFFGSNNWFTTYCSSNLFRCFFGCLYGFQLRFPWFHLCIH